MKSFLIKLLAFLVCLALLSTIGSADCQDRDLVAATAEDSTRECRNSCTHSLNCTSPNKDCHCDDLCGYSCYNPDAECPDPTGTLENGVVKVRQGISYGKRATYTCNDGYYHTGVKERICRSTKKWSHTAPNCTQGCIRPNKYNNGFPDVELETGFKVGTVASYLCNSGYTLVDPTADVDIECRADFTWEPIQFDCRKVLCGHPGTISHGILEGEGTNNNGVLEDDNFDFGSYVTYKCNPGHDISGTARLSCRADGKWRPLALPTCTPVTCRAPPIIANGDYDETFAPNREFEDFLTYSCNDGYKLLGNSEVKCNETGEWDGVPSCVVNLDCGFEVYIRGTCDYTVISGTFSREEQEQSNTFPGYSLKGDGVLKSVEVPLAGDEEGCIELEYMTTKPDTLEARATDSSNTKLLWSAVHSTTWKDAKFRLVKVKADQDSVFLEFVATADVILDNIKQIDNAECATLTIPTTATSTTPSTTTIPTAPTAPTTPTTTTTPTIPNRAEVTPTETVSSTSSSTTLSSTTMTSSSTIMTSSSTSMTSSSTTLPSSSTILPSSSTRMPSSSTSMTSSTIMPSSTSMTSSSTIITSSITTTRTSWPDIWFPWYVSPIPYSAIMTSSSTTVTSSTRTTASTTPPTTTLCERMEPATKMVAVSILIVAFLVNIQ